MPWSDPKVLLTSAVTVDSTTRQDQSTNTFSIGIGEAVQIQVSATVNAASPLLMFIEPTLDATTEQWDNSGQPVLILAATGVKSVTISTPMYKARVSYALQTGATAATAVTANYRKWTAA